MFALSGLETYVSYVSKLTLRKLTFRKLRIYVSNRWLRYANVSQFPAVPPPDPLCLNPRFEKHFERTSAADPTFRDFDAYGNVAKSLRFGVSRPVFATPLRRFPRFEAYVSNPRFETFVSRCVPKCR